MLGIATFALMKSRLVCILLPLLFAAESASSQPAINLTADDRAAIQALVTHYAQALSGCHAAEFADLFVPGTGYFASGFRGRMVGRERLIALVESERQCVAPRAPAAPARPGGASGPIVAIEVTGGSVRGIASLGTTEYQDEYAKTPQGWRFAARTVVTGPEKAAGLDAAAMLEIQRLGGANLGDHYEPDQNGVSRLMTSGVKITASADRITGRAYLKDGSYDDQVYEKLDAGQWRVKSTTHVTAAAR